MVESDAGLEQLPVRVALSAASWHAVFTEYSLPHEDINVRKGLQWYGSHDTFYTEGSMLSCHFLDPVEGFQVLYGIWVQVLTSYVQSSGSHTLQSYMSCCREAPRNVL